MSKTMMLMASALTLAAPCTLTAASPGNVPSTNVMRPDNNQHLATTTQAEDARAAQSMHFAIQGRTATWSFRFTCTGAHCSFHNSHHARNPQDLGVTIATTFDQQFDRQIERDNAQAFRVRRVTK